MKGVTIIFQDAETGLNKRQSACNGDATAALCLHTAQASLGPDPSGCTFLARNPRFSRDLEKQKSAEEQAAGQSEGTRLMEDVGTVPAEATGRLCSWLGWPCRKGPRQQGWVSYSRSQALNPEAQRREGRKVQTKREPKVPGGTERRGDSESEGK